MNLPQWIRRIGLALSLVVMVVTMTACGTPTLPKQSDYQQPGSVTPGGSSQYERGNTAQSENFGNWVVQTSRGLVQDAYVRDNNKLGVVISPQVKPNEVRPLARSLTQGFQKNFPNRDLTVLVYAPDRKLILTAKYDNATNQLSYQS